MSSICPGYSDQCVLGFNMLSEMLPLQREETQGLIDSILS